MSTQTQAQAAIAERALVVVYRPPAQLKPDPRNPRQHSPRQIKQLARSIQALGFNVPVLVDRGDRIIAGHARVLAAGKLGVAAVPTICLDHLSEAQIAAYKIADNRLSELSTWDDRLLGRSFAISRRSTSTFRSRLRVSIWARSISGSKAWKLQRCRSTLIRPTWSLTR